MAKELLQRGIAAHRAGKYKEADEAYTAILKIDPTHPDANHNMGVLAVDIGKPALAIPFFENALRERKTILQYWLSLADAYRRLGKSELAFELTNREDIKALSASAAMLVKKAASGETDIVNVDTRTKDKFDKTDDGQSEKLLDASHGIAHLLRGDINGAETILKDVLNSDPGNKLALDGLRFVELKRSGNKGTFSTPPSMEINRIIKLFEHRKFVDVRETTKSMLEEYPFSPAIHSLFAASNYELNNITAAVEHYEAAIFIDPDFADAHYNLGVLLHTQENYAEAAVEYMKVIAISPTHTKAYNNLGNIYLEQGEYGKALDAYKNGLLVNLEVLDLYKNFSSALQYCQFQRSDPVVVSLICQLLKRPGDVRPKDVATPVFQLLKFEPAIMALITDDGPPNTEYSITLNELEKNDLLLTFMSVCPISDIEIEGILKRARCFLLLAESERRSGNFEKFQVALALQCFTNEYIFDSTENEMRLLNKLIIKVENILKLGEHPDDSDILCIASYTPLCKYPWAVALKPTSVTRDVVQRQIYEPAEEIELSKEIPSDLSISDKTSLKVQDQYENNPYPRWMNVKLAPIPVAMDGLVRATNMKLYSKKILEHKNLEVLVAGCGTGQHPIGTASRLANSSITAIDLSLSSLAYAKRKTRELGVKNIEYMQYDILNVASLNKYFHIIETSGVLHHMKDPFLGWQALSNRLVPGGLMRIGLYSEIARKHIAVIREEINAFKIGCSPEEMKNFREMAIKSNNPNHRNLLDSPDFYSVSTLRDLLFHVQEHRFTIAQLKDYINKLGFNFCGFEHRPLLKNFKTQFNEPNAEYDLDNWNQYERNNPNSFAGMYQFWCQKVE